jgi:hypothetical protein
MASKSAELTDLIALLVSPHATSVTGAKYVIDGTVPTAQPDLATLSLWVYLMSCCPGREHML